MVPLGTVFHTWCNWNNAAVINQIFFGIEARIQEREDEGRPLEPVTHMVTDAAPKGPTTRHSAPTHSAPQHPTPTAPTMIEPDSAPLATPPRIPTDAVLTAPSDHSLSEPPPAKLQNRAPVLNPALLPQRRDLDF